MRELLIKFFLIVFILLLIKIPFVLFYKDEVSYRKFEISKHEYNVVLIGSSRTQYGIQPTYFDSLSYKKTKTYNFGISAGILPYTFDWCEELIKTKKSIKYIIFELNGSGGIPRTYTEPWVEFRLKDYLKAVQTFHLKESIKYHDKLISGFFKPQLINVKHFDNNQPLEKNYEEYSFPVVEISPLELSLAQKRNLAVEKDDLNITTEADSQLWQRIVRLITLAEASNIQIYFFIPPRLETDNELKTVSPLWQKLDEKYKLRVNHYEEVLYTIENSVDEFHLNHKGAIRFTENLANAFDEKD